MTATPETPEAAGLDHAKLLREIDEEVRARRASGDFPPGMERDLDLVFARFAPPTVSGDDLDGLVEAVDRTSLIDANPPTGSRLPAISLLKRVERKLLGWFFRYLAQQMTAFGSVVVQTFRHLGHRVEALEQATPGANRALLDTSLRITSPTTSGAGVDDAVLAHLRGTTGRVLVVEAGDGALLRRLADTADLDVYGVEPRAELVEAAALAGLDMRRDEALDHLRRVDDGALGGVVLVGVVDRLPVGTLLAVLDRAVCAVAEGGRLAVLSSDPERWATDNPVAADLAPGRPLHAATWAHLLQEHGCRDVAVLPAGASYVVTARR